MSNLPDQSRRTFLLAGGASVLGAATLAACSGSSVVNTSGTIPATDVPATVPVTTPDPAMLEAERSLLRTATSLEHSLAAFYTKFVGAAYLDDAARTWGGRFENHHRANATRLETLTRDAGGEAWTEPNAYVDAKLIESALAQADAEQSADKLIDLAAQLEATGAATDTLAVPSIVTPELRAGIMEVGATNSRQAYLWRLVRNVEDPAAALPDALLSLQDALPAAASVDAEDTADGGSDEADSKGDDKADDKGD